MTTRLTFTFHIASALCFSSLVNFALAGSLHVEGKVYCDPCRVEFETKISEMISGATVKLECHDRDNNSLTYSVEGVTNDKGVYRLPVDEGDHEQDICEVKLIKSGMADCNEPFKTTDRARILLTKNVGVVQSTRYANPLGFMKKEPYPECGEVLKSMGFVPLNVVA